MTRAQILGAAALVSTIILIAGGAAIRGAHPDAQLSPNVQQSIAEVDFEPPVTTRKSDRIPMPAPPVMQPEPNPAVSSPPRQLQAATEDDIRQAEDEHHRHRQICSRGKTYFTMNHHQYWRCKL
jgi:hypothetical protein